MSILGTAAIEAALADGRIVCDPAPARVEGAHIDVRLGANYYTFEPPPSMYSGIFMTEDDWAINLGEADPAQFFTLCEPSLIDGAVWVPARGLILAHTAEAIGTANGSGLVPMLHTRSTLARWGLSVCTANAGQGDPGYCAPWTLEIINPHPVAVALPVGARVGAISFHRVEGEAAEYRDRYNATRETWTPAAMLPRKGNW